MKHNDINVRVFISQPMSGRTAEAVAETRAEAEKVIDKYFCKFHNNTYEIVTTFHDQEAKDAENFNHPKLYRLGHALMVLASCDYIYFAGDWKNKRSCVIEFLAARMFGVNIITPDKNVNTSAKISIVDQVMRDYEY